MHRLLPLLASLFLVLLSWTGTAHASCALVCDAEPRTEMATHFEGDRDQVPADADKDYPHHHNFCHGHHAATTAVAVDAIRLVTAEIVPIGSMFPLTPVAPQTRLRPPRA